MVDGCLGGVDPTLLGSELLGASNGDRQEQPKELVGLGKVINSGTINFSVEQHGRSGDTFADQETYRRQHGDASVRELGFTVSLESVFVGLVGKSSRVEETNRRQGSRDVVLL